MTAFDLIEHLEGRGFALALDAAGRVLVKPANRLTPEDRAAIKQHMPAIKRLLSSDYSDHLDGWQPCPAITSRAVLIHRGRLLDSVCFESAPAAADFLRRVLAGEPAADAFKQTGTTEARHA